jgi:putative ABC transport system permease protein
MRPEHWLYTIPLRLRSLFRGAQADQELDDELRDHLDLKTEQYVAHGMTQEEAHRRARLDLGGIEQTKEKCRDNRRVNWIQDLIQDLRYGLRTLRKSPGFTAVAILTLALGVGATTAVFSVVDRTLFRSLPYPHSDRLVTFGYIAPIEPLEFVLPPDFAEWSKASAAFGSTASYDYIQDCDITQAPAERVACVHTSASLLPTFEIQPLLGRNFTAAEDIANAPKVALLFYRLWKSRFGGDPHIVGKTISLDGQLTTILGVLPRNFEFPTLGRADLLVPEAFPAETFAHDNNRPMPILRAFARLKPGVTMEQAKAALQPSFEASLKWVPPGFRKEVSLSVRSLRDLQIQGARLASWVLFGAVLAVLLIACANVANLLLARSSARQREFAVRTALGAGPARLLRQMLAENVTLALAGGALGCGIAYALLKIFIAISPQGISHLDDATFDLRVLLFTLVVSIVCGIVFGFASTRPTVLNEALYGRASSTLSRAFFRRALVSAQIGISFVLLAGAGLLIRSLDNLERVPLGMDASGVITATIALNPRLYSDMSRRENFFGEIEQRLRQLPGVSAFAMSDTLPPSGPEEASIYANIEVPGRPHTPQGTGGMVGYRTVTPGYFSTLGIPILRGRGFTETDRSPDVSVTILGSLLAKRLFLDGDALGKQVRFQPNSVWCLVIGIAGNVKYVQGSGFVAPAESEYYLPQQHSAHFVDPQQRVILRTSLNPAAVAPWMRKTVASLDPTVPVTIDSMSQRVRQLEARPRFNAALLGIFATIGILLAALGTYGVLAFLVAQRTREIGICMALGAQRRDVMKLILAQGTKLALAGLFIGVAGAFAVTRSMAALLFEVKPVDPAIFSGVAIFLILVALGACYIPARRATRVDPMVALRYE